MLTHGLCTSLSHLFARTELRSLDEAKSENTRSQKWKWARATSC